MFKWHMGILLRGSQAPIYRANISAISHGIASANMAKKVAWAPIHDKDDILPV